MGFTCMVSAREQHDSTGVRRRWRGQRFHFLPSPRPALESRLVSGLAVIAAAGSVVAAAVDSLDLAQAARVAVR